ncbi:MAG: hypothetical protein U5L45_16795 [Saprospiraceae bacterium]|nr:hypothetical protein [Saprospiraceae bacterium]
MFAIKNKCVLLPLSIERKIGLILIFEYDFTFFLNILQKFSHALASLARRREWFIFRASPKNEPPFLFLM